MREMFPVAPGVPHYQRQQIEWRAAPLTQLHVLPLLLFPNVFLVKAGRTGRQRGRQGQEAERSCWRAAGRGHVANAGGSTMCNDLLGKILTPPPPHTHTHTHTLLCCIYTTLTQNRESLRPVWTNATSKGCVCG